MASIPLLGREEELKTLEGAFQLARHGQGRVIFITGEAGMGKSALLDSFAQRIAASPSNALVLLSRSYEQDSDLPYASWHYVVDRNPDLSDSFPEPIGTQAPAARGSVVLARRVVTEVVQISRKQPMVLMFDDVQWADESSLQLVRALAHRTDTTPIVIILTFSTASKEQPPVSWFVPTLMRECTSKYDYIELRPIGGHAIRTFLDAHGPLLLPEERQELAGDLIRLSGGNALYLSELLSVIDPAESRLDAVRQRLYQLPPTLRQIIQYRLTELSPSAQETLRWAAIGGHTADVELLSLVSGHAPATISEDLDEGLMRGLLIVTDKGQLAFRHGVVRETLVAGQSVLRRRQQHAAFMRALQSRPTSSPLEIALHAEQAGDSLRASEALERAAQDALRIFAMPEAARLYARALDHAVAAGVDPVHQDALRLAYGDAILRIDRGAAEEAVERVIARALARNDEITLARARQRRATLLYEAGHRSDAVDILDDIIPILERVSDWATLAEALTCRGYCASSASQFGEVRQIARRLQALAANLDNPTYRAIALNFLATAAVALGEPEDAPRLARESVTILSELGRLDLATAFAMVALVRVDLFANLHRPDQVAALVREAAALDEEGDRRIGSGPTACQAQTGIWWFLRGDWSRVHDVLSDLGSIRQGAWSQTAKDVVHTVAAELALGEGRLAEAEELLRYIAPEPSAPLGNHSYQQWLMAVDRLALLRLEAGDLQGAEVWLDALDRALEEKPHVPGELLLELGRARLLVARGEREAALRVIQQTIKRATDTRNVLFLIWALRIQADALDRLGRTAEAWTAASAAIDAAERGGLRYEVALSALLRGDIGHRHADYAAKARADLERAEAELARLGAPVAVPGAGRPARRSRRQGPAGLTRREIEVLRLVARGYSDRQIAETLFISPRTAGTHVSNMLNRLGASNRVELAALAFSLGLLEPDSDD